MENQELDGLEFASFEDLVEYAVREVAFALQRVNLHADLSALERGAEL